MALTTSAQRILEHSSGQADGVPEEFWTLVGAYRGELVNQALAIVGDLADAEDAAQETLCEAWRQGRRLAQAESLGAWLRAINRRNAQDRLRAKGRQARAPRPERTATTGGFSLIEMRESLARAIETLPPAQRGIVVLRFWEGLSYEEIGARMQMPVTKVWRLFFEATERLHERLKPALDGTGETKS